MSSAQQPRYRVLVVQYDDALRDTLQEVLEDTGYEVLQARESQEALEIMRAKDSGNMVVVLDQFMPRLDGIELLREIAKDRKLARRFSFILLSAARHSMRLAIVRLFTQLAVQVMAKPFDIDDFLAAVAAASRRLAKRS